MGQRFIALVIKVGTPFDYKNSKRFNMKKIATFAIFVLTINFAMAQDTATVFINGKAAGSVVTKGEEPVNTVTIKKMKAALLKSVIIKLRGNYSSNLMYHKTLQAMEGEVLLLNAEETKDTAGSFLLPVNLIRKKITGGKKIKLVLQVDPANKRMMMPSRIIPVGFIIMQ